VNRQTEFWVIRVAFLVLGGALIFDFNVVLAAVLILLIIIGVLPSGDDDYGP